MLLSKNIKNNTLKVNLFLFFLVFVNPSFSQALLNVIGNSSFEQYTMCPSSNGQVDNVPFWYLPTGGTTDYFNLCTTFTYVSVPTNFFGEQNARTGSAYMGFAIFGDRAVPWIEYREYLGSGLKQQLKSNKTYCVTYFVSLAEISRYATANIGVVFSQDSIFFPPSFPDPPLVLTPDIENTVIITDTINWTEIQGTYLSNGTERFITIGNFRTDANTFSVQVKPLNIPYGQKAAYYYMDDISVIEINNADAAIQDSILKCDLANVKLGTDSTEFATYKWASTATGLAALSCTNCPNPNANPSITTKYYLTKQHCGVTTIDSVKIIIDDCDPTFVLPNVFTPNGDGINDTWGINFSTVNSHIKIFKMSIYDRWGLLIYSTNHDYSTPNSKWDGRTTAGIECNAGVYFYVITFTKNEEEQKLSGHLSLFR